MLPIAATSLSLLLLFAPQAPHQPAKAQVPISSASRTAEPLDINRAGVAELTRLPGMTRVWAERIVRFRPYRTKQDLADDGIIPGSVYRRIKDSIIAHRPKQ